MAALPNVESIFSAALELASPEDRAAFLDRACGGDGHVRQRVEQLLAAHGQVGSFLEATTGFASADPGRMAYAAGTRIGPYKLLQQIGEGGMGAVFMAEQEQPVRRRVAVKIIKPGMDSKQVIARFEAERQALAMMDHLNIARVLDANATQTGQPYFVMELIHGVAITRYCDDNRLSVRERLELFVPVCQAIQHAHQKGIIHRDVKPSNILVTLYDGRPVPKVIDFGVAKATEQRLSERTMFTEYGTAVGTFEYMSPEQAEMSALGVDTRSDIYSLGVLLYQLLTGTTPLEQERLRQAGLTEKLRMIREEEPRSPSARLSCSHALEKVAQARKTDPARLMKLVRGELDWIVMKCLEKDRTRRYESASGLARDVQRYLADEPVEACPPSASYRLRRLARKYRRGLAAAAACVLLLVLGVIFTTWQAVRATRAEERVRALADQMQEQRDKAQLRLTQQVAKRIEADLKRLMFAGDTLRATLTHRNKDEEAELVGWMRDVVKRDRLIFGLTLGFEPRQFAGKEDYCLYVCRGGKDQLLTKHLHDDPRYKYRQQAWYTRPQTQGNDLWGDPYFDDGGADIWIVSYSVRLVRNGAFVGVLTVDLPLLEYSTDLQRWLEELKPEVRYGFVASADGRLISHPTHRVPPARGALRKITDVFPTDLTDRLKAPEGGRQPAWDPTHGEPATFLFAPVQHARWALVVVVPEMAEPPRRESVAH